jgi:ribokinase
VKIVVLGSINMDLVVRVPHLPVTGETLRGTDFFTVPGGKGANQAVAAARMGGDVTLIGRVGDDDLGRRAKEALEREGVDTSSVRIDPDEATGVALISVAEDGENTIVTSGGANHRIGEAELGDLGRAMNGCDVLLVQLEVPMTIVDTAVRLAREASASVVLDPAPVAPLSSSVLGGLDWITPNDVEAEALTGHTDPRQACDALLARGVRNVVVTLGPDGCVYNGLHIPAPTVEAIDTVACGDAFDGALAVALASGASALEALQRGCAAGALAATKQGAQTSLPTAAEVDRLLN